MRKVPFEIGDKIVCIDSKGTIKQLIQGQVYVVKRPNTNGYVSVEGLDGGWFYSRFDLVEKASSEKRERISDLDRLEKLEKQMERIIRTVYAGKSHLEEILRLGDKPEEPRLKPKRRIEID